MLHARHSRALADRPPPPPDETQKSNAAASKEMWRLTGRFSFIGIEFGVAILLGLVAGQWLDGKLGTDPWMTLLLIALGFTAATRDLFRLARAHKKELAKEDAERTDIDDL